LGVSPSTTRPTRSVGTRTYPRTVNDPDLIAERDYLRRRFVEAVDVRDRAIRIVDELAACLADPGAYGQIPRHRFARWSEHRRSLLSAWLEEREEQIDHLEVELFVLAYAPVPPVVLVVSEVPARWPTPWATVAAWWRSFQ